MTPLSRLEVTVSLGARRRTLPASSLEPGLRAAVLRLLFNLDYPQAVHEERGEGVRVASPAGENVNAEYLVAFPETFLEGKGEGSGEDHRETIRTVIELRARYLADLLDDHGSLAWYRLVARTVPSNVIDEALARARAVPAAELRRSRAAYFTALIRHHVPKTHSNPRFHAISPPSP